ncbi:MAG: hypothetical protein ACRCUJ_04225 [Phocaeicola sp.]
MARIPELIISTNAVRAILGTTDRDLWWLGRHPNINKFAKYSPDRVGGSAWIPYSSGNILDPQLLSEIVYNRVSPPYTALTYFANYDDSNIVPVALMFPESLKKGKNNGFMPAFFDTGEYLLSLRDILKLNATDELYMCTVLRHSNGQYLYTTEPNDVDLTNTVWAVGSSITVFYVATNKRHFLSDIDSSATYWGVKFPDTEVSKSYTLAAGDVTPEGINGITQTNTAMYYNYGTYARFTNTSGGLSFTISLTNTLSTSKDVTISIIEGDSNYSRLPIGSISAAGNTTTTRTFAPSNYYAKEGLMKQLYLEFSSGSERFQVMLPQRIEQ